MLSIIISGQQLLPALLSQDICSLVFEHMHWINEATWRLFHRDGQRKCISTGCTFKVARSFESRSTDSCALHIPAVHAMTLYSHFTDFLLGFNSISQGRIPVYMGVPLRISWKLNELIEVTKAPYLFIGSLYLKYQIIQTQKTSWLQIIH